MLTVVSILAVLEFFALCGQWFRLCELAHECKLSRMADKALAQRIATLEDKTEALEARPATAAVDADDMKAVARAALVDALQCAEDSLAFDRQDGDGDVAK